MRLDFFTPATRAWLTEAFDAPTAVQQAGWASIAAGHHSLLLAPTGSGKTLAAFLWAIDRLLHLPPDAPAGVRVLYVSPLKALVYDIERNLRGPLRGILRTAERLGMPCRDIGIDIRTGDTPQALRRQQLRTPADILVTTPESLYLLLGSQAGQTLQTCNTVIVDEVHALAPTKRGAHLALSLERLSTRTHSDPQRIGLSATVTPHSEAARFLGGTRAVTVVDKSALPAIDLRIVVPVADMENPPPVPQAPPPGGSLLRPDTPGPQPEQAGMWAVIYPQVLALLRAHRSVIVFVNSRSVCERMSRRLNELAEEDLVRAHHGSLALKRRMETEELLKEGQLRGIIATSSLELGIDMGAVDLVVLVESPGSVGRGLQRVGRAGHQVGATSLGVMLPKFRGDLLECAVVAERMRQGALEDTLVPHNALDVLAQQIVAQVSVGATSVGEVGAWVRRSYPYQQLSEEALIAVLDMLSGTYPSDDFADLRPHLAWDRQNHMLTARRGAKLVAVLNAGTIPDRGLFGVFLGQGGPRVGELDEEMVYESRKGDTFMLGATTWRVEQITRDQVLVSPAPGEAGRMPFWRGDGPGRPVSLGRAMGAFVREVGALDADAARAMLENNLHLDPHAASNLWQYIYDQQTLTGVLPTDTTVVVERFRDEIGDWRVCILTPFGARVHAPWALALEAMLTKRTGQAVQATYGDDGIVLRFADSDIPPPVAQLMLDPATVEDDVTEQLGQSALFASAFRENASRALLLPRRRGQGRTPLWQQRLKAKMLMAAAQRYPSFPIVLETYRQCLRDIFDLPSLIGILEAIERRDIRVVDVETPHASPFARGLAFAYIANYLYEKDAPQAERRAHALTLDRSLLRELLGQSDMRSLLDADVIAEVTDDLQHLGAERRARDADELHDVLRHLGDLSVDELQQRATADVRPWLEKLQNERRIVALRVAKQARYICVEEAGRYRDAFGTLPPAGLPSRFLQDVPDARLDVWRRYARHRGPFVAEPLAARYAWPVASLVSDLDSLTRGGLLVHGALSPTGETPEWCDPDVLRRLKRATLAKVRGEAAAVPAIAYAEFLPRWHRMDAPPRGPRALEEALTQLEGVALPWSAWCTAILPLRIADFHVDMLDMLCATGAFVWMGHGALGPRDGRVSFVRRASAHLALRRRPMPEDMSDDHRRILAHLETQGACFTVELSGVVPALQGQALVGVLLDLIWAGLITNDTVQPLRALSARTRHPRSAPWSAMMGGRWSRVGAPDTGDDAQARNTRQAHHLATQLLERYAVVCREAAAAEDIAGGFSAVYDVYKTMEAAGKVRRGYFVEGVGGAQFAHAFAIERLRAQRQGSANDPPGAVQILAALDPAQVYGALLPWPQKATEDGRALRRVAGAWVISYQGALLGYVDAKGASLVTFMATRAQPDAAALLVAGCKRIAAHRRRRMLRLQHIDEDSALLSSWTQGMMAAGAAHTFDGLLIDTV